MLIKWPFVYVHLTCKYRVFTGVYGLHLTCKNGIRFKGFIYFHDLLQAWNKLIQNSDLFMASLKIPFKCIKKKTQTVKNESVK